MILEISNLHQVSGNDKEEAASYSREIQSYLEEVKSSHANTIDQMGDILQQRYPSDLHT